MTHDAADMRAYEKRFAATIALLCGKEPPEQIVHSWLTSDCDKLQHFCIEHGPSWSQGIALIDAAHAVACQPPERPIDVAEEDWYELERPARAL